MSTLAEKIIARAAGRRSVAVGEIVTCAVDLAMIHDSGGPRRVRPVLERLGRPVWDPRKVVVVTDHFVPADTPEAQAIQVVTREWVEEQGVRSFYDRQGICHVVLPERGHLAPGMFCVGGDSHSPTGGALGAFMFGIGSTEMAGVLATGEVWIRVPETILVRWDGSLGDLVCAKDMMLAACARLGMGGGRYQAVQYCGDAVAGMPMQERMTLANMSAELGAQAGLVAPDETAARYVRDAGGDLPEDWEDYRIERAAPEGNEIRFDAGGLAPQIAAPHSPANAAPAGDLAGTPIDVAYIGACTGAKHQDLAAAASVLRGRKAASGVTLAVAPASVRDRDRAAADGTLGVLEDAGAKVLPSACGMCAGYGNDRLAAGQVCVSSTARNFRGRMGDPGSLVYLASPYTVAASAVAGALADPRQVAHA